MPVRQRKNYFGFTAYEGQWPILDELVANVDKGQHESVKEIGFQHEICPDTQRKHRQGYIVLTRIMSMSTVIKMLPGIHIFWADNLKPLKDYCHKEKSRDVSLPTVLVENPRAKQLHEIMTYLGSIVWRYEGLRVRDDYSVVRVRCKKHDDAMHKCYDECEHRSDENLTSEQVYRIACSEALREFPQWLTPISTPAARYAWRNHMEVFLEKSKPREVSP